MLTNTVNWSFPFQQKNPQEHKVNYSLFGHVLVNTRIHHFPFTISTINQENFHKRLDDLEEGLVVIRDYYRLENNDPILCLTYSANEGSKEIDCYDRSSRNNLFVKYNKDGTKSFNCEKCHTVKNHDVLINTYNWDLTADNQVKKHIKRTFKYDRYCWNNTKVKCSF